MAEVKTGVFPVHSNEFEIGTAGEASIETDFKTVKNIETFQVTIDGTVEEWTALDKEGWMSRLVTAKSLTISLAGKRDYGDPGNDYVAGLAWKTGRECNSKFKWVLPSGATLEFDCVVNTTEVGGGDAPGVASLTVDILSNGKPTYTPAVAG